MPDASCAICEKIAEAGVTTQEGEICPPEESTLEEIAIDGILRRCRSCGTLYRYRHHYEYDVAGSWDEYYLWRLGPVAQKFVEALLATPASRRDEQWVQGLQHEDAATRDAVTALLWTCIKRGPPISDAVIPVACQAMGHGGWTMQYGYRAILAYLQQGSREKGLARQALETTVLSGTSESYRKTLLNQARK